MTGICAGAIPARARASMSFATIRASVKVKAKLLYPGIPLNGLASTKPCSRKKNRRTASLAARNRMSCTMVVVIA